MYQNTAIELINLLQDHLPNNGNGVPPYLQVLSTIRFLAEGSYQKGLGTDQNHCMSQSSISRTLHSVIPAMNALAPRFIIFPSTPEERQRVQREFRMSCVRKNYDCKIAGLYDLEETLGKGHFAVVKLARHVFTGEKVAVKVIDKSKLDDVSRAHLFQEVRCMKLVQHPNVVRLYEVIDTHTKLYLVLELGDGGDLYDYIMRHEGGLSEKVARTYFWQIVKAISYCHRLHVVHRDLKPENVVFFEKSGTVKLTDFGFSNRYNPGQKLETSCGSLAYSAPEILLGESYDAPAVDVWSLGVILYMLVCGQLPFQEANDSETLTMIMDCRYSIPKHVSDKCKTLIAKMLIREPEKRASLDEIEKDEWFFIEQNSNNIESLPLVLREQVSEEHHNLIITKMVNGNIATKEEIINALDKNEYNHLTATYFLLAERKLKANRQDFLKTAYAESSSTNSRINESLDREQTFFKDQIYSTNFIQIPRLRKCSIVQEEDEDVSSGKEDKSNHSIFTVLNRRGSRSEGKLSHILKEKLSPAKSFGLKSVRNPHEESLLEELSFNYEFKINSSDSTSISSSINDNLRGSLFSRNKQIDSHKLKFNRPKISSHSSSDASDNEDRNRKKRADKLNVTPALFKKRDGHDDSSDSQDPGGSGIGETSCSRQSCHETPFSKSSKENDQSKTSTPNNSTGQRQQSNYDKVILIIRNHPTIKQQIKHINVINTRNEYFDTINNRLLISKINAFLFMGLHKYNNKVIIYN